MATKPKARIPQELKMADAIPVSTQGATPVETLTVPAEVPAVKKPRGTVTIGPNGETITDF